MDVRDSVLRDAAASGKRDRCTLGDLRAFVYQHRPQVKQRRRVSVASLDRDRAPAAGNRAGEGNASIDRRKHGRTERPLDVDTAVLAGLERELGIEDVRAEHRPGQRPRPGLRRAGEHQRGRHEGTGEDEVSLPGMQTDSYGT